MYFNSKVAHHGHLKLNTANTLPTLSKYMVCPGYQLFTCNFTCSNRKIDRVLVVKREKFSFLQTRLGYNNTFQISKDSKTTWNCIWSLGIACSIYQHQNTVYSNVCMDRSLHVHVTVSAGLLAQSDFKMLTSYIRIKKHKRQNKKMELWKV